MRFRASLAAEGGGHHIALTPAQVKALHGRPHARVKGTIHGAPLRSAMFPYGGTYYVLVHKATVQAGGLRPGLRYAVALEPDRAPRRVPMPADLRAALAAHPRAKAAFAALAFTHRKEYARWVTEAKRPATRARRVREAVARCARGLKPAWE